jgi:hypothetical protein
MQYEVYRQRNATDAEFEEINQIYKRILSEDKWLCNETQKNLNAGTYVNGQMHSTYESGPLYFQGLVRKMLRAHRNIEERNKGEVWPAAPSMTMAESGDTDEDAAFCSSLSCEGQSKLALAW